MASLYKATETCDEKLCPICREKYRVARSMLTCVHAFCEECLCTFVFDLKKRGELGSTFECPVCRKHHPVGDSEQKMLEWVKSFPLCNENAEMDLAGKEKDSKINLSSRMCGLCEARGHSAMGTNYCMGCRSYLCADCVLVHGKFPLFISHKFLQEYDSVCELFTTALAKLSNCLIHPNRNIELFCKSTDELLCWLCKATTHTNCDQDVSISQDSSLSEKLVNSVKARIASAHEHLTVLEQYSTDNSKLINEQLTRLVEEVEAVRVKIIATLDTIVENILANRKQLKINTEDSHFATKQKCDHLRGKFDKKLYILEKVLNHGTNAERFAAAMKIDDDVRGLEQEVFDFDSTFAVGAIDTAKTVDVLRKFADELNADRVPSTTIEYTSGKHRPGYKASPFTPTPFEIDRADKHNLRINSDCIPMFTSICTSHDGILMLCDQCGHLCLYDGRNKQTFKMAKPFGVTVLDKSIAITLPNQLKIVVMSKCFTNLRSEKINTDHTPMTIVALKDGTVALSWKGPPAFSISDISGSAVENKVYFTQDSDGRTFRSFDYMAVDEKRHNVIQPCQEGKVVYCFDFAGKPVFKYTNGMRTPKGAAVDMRSGCVFVCDLYFNNIHQLTCAGVPLTVIKHNTLWRPLDVCFDKQRNALWVSSSEYGQDEVMCYLRKE